jgi:hypothetical protein
MCVRKKLLIVRVQARLRGAVTVEDTTAVRVLTLS